MLMLRTGDMQIRQSDPELPVHDAALDQVCGICEAKFGKKRSSAENLQIETLQCVLQHIRQA